MSIRRTLSGNGILCPRCNGLGSDVKDSRAMDGYIRRRRECRDCKRRFTTREIEGGEMTFLRAARLASDLERLSPDGAKVVNDMISLLSRANLVEVEHAAPEEESDAV